MALSNKVLDGMPGTPTGQREGPDPVSDVDTLLTAVVDADRAQQRAVDEQPRPSIFERLQADAARVAQETLEWNTRTDPKFSITLLPKKVDSKLLARLAHVRAKSTDKKYAASEATAAAAPEPALPAPSPAPSPEPAPASRVKTSRPQPLTVLASPFTTSAKRAARGLAVTRVAEPAGASNGIKLQRAASLALEEPSLLAGSSALYPLVAGVAAEQHTCSSPRELGARMRRLADCGIYTVEQLAHTLATRTTTSQKVPDSCHVRGKARLISELLLTCSRCTPSDPGETQPTLELWTQRLLEHGTALLMEQQAAAAAAEGGKYRESGRVPPSSSTGLPVLVYGRGMAPQGARLAALNRSDANATGRPMLQTPLMVALLSTPALAGQVPRCVRALAAVMTAGAEEVGSSSNTTTGDGSGKIGNRASGSGTYLHYGSDPSSIARFLALVEVEDLRAGHKSMLDIEINKRLKALGERPFTGAGLLELANKVDLVTESPQQPTAAAKPPAVPPSEEGITIVQGCRLMGAQGVAWDILPDGSASLRQLLGSYQASTPNPPAASVAAVGGTGAFPYNP